MPSEARRAKSMLQEPSSRQSSQGVEDWAVGDGVPRTKQQDLREAAREAEGERQGRGRPRLRVPGGAVLLAHVGQDDGQEEAAKGATKVPKEVHIWCHRRHGGHRDQHEDDPEDRALPCRAEDLPGQEDLRQPDPDEAEARGRGAHGQLVRVEEDADEVAENPACKVDGDHLPAAELLLHSEAHPQLEEDVEKEVREVGVEHHRGQQPPDLAPRNRRPPGRPEPVEHAGRRVGLDMPQHHGENELGHLPAGNLPHKGIRVEAREDQSRELLLLLHARHHEHRPLLQGRRSDGAGSGQDAGRAAAGHEQVQGDLQERWHELLQLETVQKSLCLRLLIGLVQVGTANTPSPWRSLKGYDGRTSVRLWNGVRSVALHHRTAGCRVGGRPRSRGRTGAQASGGHPPAPALAHRAP
mmetsp:Transcript_87447/g.271712  ORF Transcript_87447/g.271712 Transcript_87447/m.271712 type:complete len:411 (-) Transcript_87447:98-1330(-)